MPTDARNNWQTYVPTAGNLASTNCASTWATAGTGTPGDPFRGWLGRLPVLADNPVHLLPVAHYAMETALSVLGDAMSGVVIHGHGSTLVYTGSGTVQTLIDFTGDIAQFGQRNNLIRDVHIDGGGKVVDAVRSRASHYFGLENVHFRNGTGWAWRVEGCTFPWSKRSSCSSFYNSGGVGPNIANTFAGGLIVDAVTETGNATSCMLLEQFDVRGCQGTAGISLANCFNFQMISGASEANPNGVGLFIASTCSSLAFRAADFEANGSNTADIGGGARLGVIVNGQRVKFDTCESFDCAWGIGSSAVQVQFENMSINAVAYNLGDATRAESCSGAWQLAADGTTNKTDVNFWNIAPHGGGGLNSYSMVPETTVFGRGTNGAIFNNSFYDGFTLYAAGSPSPTTNYAMHQDRVNANTQVNGRQYIELMVSGADVAVVRANFVEFDKPVQLPQVDTGGTVSGVAAGFLTLGTDNKLHFDASGAWHLVTST